MLRGRRNTYSNDNNPVDRVYALDTVRFSNSLHHYQSTLLSKTAIEPVGEAANEVKKRFYDRECL